MFQLNVQPFGVILYPAICNFVMHHIASEHAASHPVAASKLERSFYVDSFPTESETIQGAKALVALEASAYNQSASLSRVLLAVFPLSERNTSELDPNLDKLPSEQSHGSIWNCQYDPFPV